MFDYYVEYAEEAVPWVISQGRSVGIEPIEFLTDSSIRYDDGSVVAVCDATQASNQDLMTALAQKAADGGATFYYETPCVQLVGGGGMLFRDEGATVAIGGHHGLFLETGYLCALFHGGKYGGHAGAARAYYHDENYPHSMGSASRLHGP